jgi:fatty acid synthase
LRRVGIDADGIIGHSTGEMCCAYADGCLTREQTILLAYWRGRSIVEAQLKGG